MISQDDVKAILENIRMASDNHERAHAMEDELYRRVLEAIVVEGDDGSAELARLALTSKGIEFERM